MISRLSGAIARGFLVAVLIALPSLILPSITSDAAQAVALVAIAVAVLTMFEYGSSYPCLYEFRDAAPFNRIRYGALFAMVLVLSLIARGATDPNSLTTFLEIVGHVVGKAMDFQYSPVRLVVLMLPEETSVRHLILVRSAAGIAHLIALISLAVFIVAIRRKKWPLQNGNFNVWINLPTFDPTAGGDVVARLERDGRLNILLGFILPFLMPVAINGASSLFGTVSLENPQTMVWAVAAWAFLPASLFMRGIAMGRIAAMIVERRKVSTAEGTGLVPA